MRSLIKTEYENFKEYLDPDFLDKIDQEEDISSRYTEILIPKLLKHYNNTLCLRSGWKKNKASPDLNASIDGLVFNIECVTPQNSKLSFSNRIPPRENGKAFSPDISKIQRMIANSLFNKIERYHAYLRDKSINPEDPFIIAVGLYGIPWVEILSYFDALVSNPIPYNVVGTFFPTGNPAFRLSMNSSIELIDTVPFLEERHNNIKENGAAVSKNIFGDLQFSPISAVLISGLNRNLTDYNDLIMVHNPNAINKFMPNRLNVFKECVLEENEIRLLNYNPLV